jgi:hypothetical protein
MTRRGVAPRGHAPWATRVAHIRRALETVSLPRR